MFEYKTVSSNNSFFEEEQICGDHHEAKVCLTKLWEVVVRTKRLPENFDAEQLFQTLRERLRDPEKEVRQNAMRVLTDLIPVATENVLVNYMKILVPDLLTNLGHHSPALRKSSLDTLRAYLKHSTRYDELLKSLLLNQSEESVIFAAPFLVSIDNKDSTLKEIVGQLWQCTGNGDYQEERAVRALARMRFALGEERFKKIIGDKLKRLEELCSTYGLPIVLNETIEEGERLLWNYDNSIEDKVILETEITLKTGPPITMQIHEESRPNSVMEEKAVLRILPSDESEIDFIEEISRTPRKVRFGGESFKTRTPESDNSSNNNNDNEDMSTIKITVRDAISIKTRKSLIPVRITSLPSTPRKKYTYKKRLTKSTPNLTKSNSRIPLRSSSKENVIQQSGNNSKVETKQSLLQPPSKMIKNKENTSPKQKMKSEEGKISPLPPHREVELLHNLMRSPERKRRASVCHEDNTDDVDKKYDSFQVCNDDKANVKPPDDEEKPKEALAEPKYDSFTVCKEETISKPPSPTKKPNYLHESLTLSSFSNEDDIWAKSEALENLVKMLNEPNICESLEAGPAALLFEALFACHQRDRLHNLADDAVLLLVEKIRLEVLEQCLSRLAIGICKMQAPSGVKLAIAITRKVSAKKFEVAIIENCFGHRTRELALQILMAFARILPSSDIDVKSIIEFSSQALRDRRRRVRQAALETLACVAQIMSPHDVLTVVTNNIQNFPDYQHLIRVLRTRLSRRQLPKVEMDGTIKYSIPRDQTEVEWLSGNNIQQSFERSSPPSSTSSSNASINYWKHNMRHDENVSISDESNTDNQKIWAVDPNIFGTKTQKNVKETKYMTLSNQNAAVLRPVYILQPERITNEQGRGYKRYDRGRSFSPPKERSSVALSRPNVTFAPNNGTFCGSAPNSISHHASSTSKYLSKPQENFKKSFSTNTLYYSNGTENASFSSRSSTTSTEGSLNKSGNWHNKDFKSGIPIPVSNCEKFKIRTTANVGSSSVGPVVARRNAFGSPIETTPVLVRSNTSEHTLNLPPRSSESESSGYFTPPESQRAFVKLDTEERTSETEEIANNNHVDCVNSYSNSTNSIFPAVETTSIKRVFSASSSDDPDVHKYSQESVVENNNSRPHSRFSQGNELENMSADIKNKNKSKSVVELQSNFLPEINNVRKLSSAPPTNNETSLNNLNNNFDETPITPLKTTVTVVPGSMELVEENIEQSVETNESVTTVRLTRRFQRSQSKKSFKSTPRSTKESPVATLRPFSKPKEALHHILSQMESNEWETIIQGLQGLMRVSRNHPETIENQMHNVCVTLSKHIKNLRSQVARVACKTAGELFESCNKKGLLEMEFEEIAAPLLQRTADTNKFLRADANAALDRMSEHMPNIRVVAVVTSRGCCHQNAIVRAASIRILSEMVKRHGPDKIFQLPIETRNKILVAGANALADGSQEARGHGKSMFALLKAQPGFHRALLEAVPQNILRHISKSLNSIKAGG